MQVVSAILIAPCFLTALFFHQGSLVIWKGWTAELLASAFIAFAVGRAISSFFGGIFVDRYSATKLFPLMLLPFAAGLLSLLWGQGPAWAFFYLGLVGLSQGFSQTLTGAIWAEFYGVSRIASIKSLQTSLAVLSTAVAPIALGILLDKSVSPEAVLAAMLVMLLFALIVSASACWSS